MTTSTAPSHPPEPRPSTALTRRPARRWRHRGLLGVAAGAALLGGVAGVDFVLDGTAHSRTVVDEAVTVIDIDVDGGGVRIVGTNEADIIIETARHGGLRKPERSETVRGDTLVVRSDCGRNIVSPSCGADILIHAPRNVKVIARGNGTDHDLTDFGGDVDISLSGGDATLEFTRAPDLVTARTSGGDITITVPDDNRIAYRVEARSSGGSTRTDIRTDPAAQRIIDARSSGGDVTITYPNQTTP